MFLITLKMSKGIIVSCLLFLVLDNTIAQTTNKPSFELSGVPDTIGNSHHHR